MLPAESWVDWKSRLPSCPLLIEYFPGWTATHGLPPCGPGPHRSHHQAKSATARIQSGPESGISIGGARRRPTFVQGAPLPAWPLFPPIAASRDNYGTTSALCSAESLSPRRFAFIETVSCLAQHRLKRREVIFGAELADFFELAFRRPDQMFHVDLAGVLGSQEGRIDHYIADVAPGKDEAFGEVVEVNVSPQRSALRNVLLPDPVAVCLVRKWEFNRKVHAAKEPVIDVAPQIGRQHHQPIEFFHTLQQVIDLDIGIAIMSILYLRAFAEKSVSFIEEQDCVAVFSLLENPAQVLFRLPNVLADH